MKLQSTLIVLYLQVFMWSPVCSDIRMRRLYAMPKSSSFFSPWNRTTKRETPKSGKDCQALTKFILASSRFRSLTFACASRIFCRNCKHEFWYAKKHSFLWQINHEFSIPLTFPYGKIWLPHNLQLVCPKWKDWLLVDLQDVALKEKPGWLWLQNHIRNPP